MAARAPLADDDGFRRYLNAIQRYPLLDRETELKLARRWQKRHDRRSAHALVCANLRFVVKIANQYRGYGFRMADLVEEGNIGLLEAVKRFDPARNLRFMTYAAYWIRAYILAHVLKQWSLVGVGTGPLQSKLFFRMARERAKISAALGNRVNEGEMEQHLADKFGTTPDRIRDMSGRLEGKDLSLNAEAFRDGTVSELDLLPDDATPGTEESCARAELDGMVRSRVQRLMASMNEREQYIVRRRLLTDEADTLAEIGRHLCLSRERVRQLEERLKGKLRRALAEFERPALRA